MRIAQITPLFLPIPPRHYGGTERIVSYITEELVDQGHEVVLFASGDSRTRAQLVACSPGAIGMHESWQTPFTHHLLMCERAYRQADQFDVIHVHIELFHAPLARRCRTPTLTTTHTSLMNGNVWRQRLFEEYDDLPLVSISQFQQSPLPGLNWQGTVYHGLPEDLYPFQERPGTYLAFLGRVAPDKGVPDAVEIAARAGIPLKIAGNPAILQESYLTEIRHLFEHPLVEYVGELDDAEKGAFLADALALLFPIQWDEPFGIVMIEALACGTPVIAYNRGSVPEIIKDGVNGVVVNSLDEAVAAVQQVATISRHQCRASFEERFTARHMVDNYLCLYQRLIQQRNAAT